MCGEIIDEICRSYKLPVNEVKTMLASKMGLTFEINEHETNYKFVKRKPKKTRVDNAMRCIANLWDFENKCPRRCTNARYHKKQDEPLSVFCPVHQRMSFMGRLAYGIADGFEEELEREMQQREQSLKPAPKLQTMPLRKQVIKRVK